jgi:hypothetical protein
MNSDVVIYLYIITMIDFPLAIDNSHISLRTTTARPNQLPRTTAYIRTLLTT